MRIIFLVLFILSSKVNAQSFHLYTKKKLKNIEEVLKVYDNDLELKNVFTQREKNLLTSEDVDTNILTLKTKLSQRFIQKTLRTVKVEKQGRILFNTNNYESYQWHLKNDGGPYERWISDIETVKIEGIQGEDINIPEYVSRRDVLIAVIDSGVDIKHPALTDNIHRNPKECVLLEEYQACLDRELENKTCYDKYAQIDANNNGYPLDCTGWSMTNKSFPQVEVQGNPKMSDLNGHGTHVAGLIKDISPTSKIIPIQVAMNSISDSPVENIAKGVLYAIKSGANIINLSLGWRFQFDSTLMREMITLAHKKGILVVAAAGNDSHTDVSYPCAYEDVICVGSHDQQGKLSSFSNKGTQVDLLAPGNDILSTWPTNIRSKVFSLDNNYEFLNGTSQSAPIVSAALGLLLSQGSSSQEARVRLLQSTRMENKPKYVRGGNLDITRALNSKIESFIYPINKDPYLVKYSGTRKNAFTLRLKNYGRPSSVAQIEITSQMESNYTVDTKSFNYRFKGNEEIKLPVTFTLHNTNESELYFNITINSDGNIRKYSAKAQFIRLLTPDSEGSDITSINILGELAAESQLKVFKDYTYSDKVDLLASKKMNKSTIISVLQKNHNGYRISKEITIREADAVVFNLSKIDIDKDQKTDYVVSYIYTDSNDNKITKFILFDHNLELKRYLIAPKNTFPNDITFLPSNFKWLNINNKMVPAWIGYGLNATPIKIDPWRAQAPREKNYFYYLTSEGLKNFSFAEKEVVLHSLFESKHSNLTETTKVIVSEGFGFLKKFKIYSIANKPKFLGFIDLKNTNQYLDLFKLKPFSLYQTNIQGAYFHESAANYTTYIARVSVDNNNKIFYIRDEIKSFDQTPITFINRIEDQSYIFQTKYNLNYFNAITGQNHSRPSKVNTARRKYIELKHSNALYLPTHESPGMSGELIKLENGKLISSNKHRILPLKDCEEVGITTTSTQDLLVFQCIESKVVKLLTLK